MTNRSLLASAAPALLLALAACGERAGDSYDGGTRDLDQIRVNPDRDLAPITVRDTRSGLEATVTIPTSPTVVYLEPSSYPERVTYLDPADRETVFYYSGSTPTTVVSRRAYRTSDRSYYVEYDGATERRVYFDDSAALRAELRQAIRERERLEREARERDERDREEWERRWRERMPRR